MKFEEYAAWSLLSLLSPLRLHTLCAKIVLPDPIESPVQASRKDNRALQYRSPGSIVFRARRKIHTCAAANDPIRRLFFARSHVRLALCRLCTWHMPDPHSIHEYHSSRLPQTFSEASGQFQAAVGSGILASQHSGQG